MPHVAILCLGDVGRSPRMQYHADAFTRMPPMGTKQQQQQISAGEAAGAALPQAEQWTVELLGYEGTPCFPHVSSNPRIREHRWAAPARARSLFGRVRKVLWQLLQLSHLLLFSLHSRPDVILVQNPPSIPTLLLARLAAWRYWGCALVIDHHNLGWSILGLDAGTDSLLTVAAKIYEEQVGSWADRHLCVTAAMATYLRATSGVEANVLHDRAQPHFKRLEAAEAHALFSRLLQSSTAGDAADAQDEEAAHPPLRMQDFATWMSGEDEARVAAFSAEERRMYDAALRAKEATPFTFVDSSLAASSASSASASASAASSSVHFRPDRPTLIVSGTSWTADEDFTILARAIQQYDALITASREGGQTAAAGEAEAGKPVKRGSARTKSPRRRKSSSAAAPADSALSDAVASSAVPAIAAAAVPLPVPSRPLPRAVFLITGRGPLRSAFDASIASMSLRYCKVFTAFLATSDYPLLLGAADLGVSLHTSSSGIDLPMKVVDLFGAGAPVCAVNFLCLSELVQDGVNGRVFGSITDALVSPASAAAAASTQLAGQFAELFVDFPSSVDDASSSAQLARLRRGALEWRAVSWQHEWNRACAPLVTRRAREQIKGEQNSLATKALAVALMIAGLLLIFSP